MSPRRALGVLLIGSALTRLCWGTALGPGPDEAYHWLFALHPDWSYYDHPPMLAWIERLGLGLLGGLAPKVLALRIGFIALFSGSTWLLARLTSRAYGSWAGVFAALILNATAYHGIAAGTFALPDGPLLFFWLLTLDRLIVAREAPERIGPWVGVGLAWGGALLSKYHGALLPVGLLLFLLLDRPSRRCLRTVGPYLAAAVGLLVFSPVIAWNVQHGWSSFAFQAGRATTGEAALRMDYVAGFIGGQAAYLLPWMWFFLLGAGWRCARRCVDPSSAASRTDCLLLSQAIVPLGVFLAISLTRPILPHWSLVGFLGLMPLLGREWAVWFSQDPRRVRRRVIVVGAAPVLGMTLFAAQARLGVVTSANDPTADLSGWDQVAAAIRARGLLGDPRTFVFTSRWFDSGQLAFALGREVPVLCYNARDAHGFAQWSRPEDWLGRDGILAVARRSSAEPGAFERFFERIEPLGTVEVERPGGPLRTVWLYRCVRQRRPFPFDGGAAGSRFANADGLTSTR
jgi:hypothetical protein